MEQNEKIRKMLQSFKTAMLVTYSPEVGPHGRPMAIAEVDPNCAVWFFAATPSGKVQEIEHDRKVLVVCQNDSRSVCLTGRAELVRDTVQARAMWKDEYLTWFPRGLDDPDLLLIHVAPVEIEYWETFGAKGWRHIFEAAKAYATGRRPAQGEHEEHAKIVVQSTGT